MKKIMIIAGMLTFGVVAANAQEQKETPTEQQQPSVQLKDMTVLKSTEIPAALRETLQAAQYKGWDAATSKIYRSPDGALYVVQIADGNGTKTFRFDKNGKPVEN